MTDTAQPAAAKDAGTSNDIQDTTDPPVPPGTKSRNQQSILWVMAAAEVSRGGGSNLSRRASGGALESGTEGALVGVAKQKSDLGQAEFGLA